MQHFRLLYVLYIESCRNAEMKNILSVIFASVLVVLSACSHEEADNLFSEYTTSQALLSDVNISLMEFVQTTGTIQAEEPGLYLYIETTDLYPYCNYGILRSTFQAGDTLVIRLEDVVKPGVTLSPPGYASTSIMIPENTNHIVFLRGSESNSFDFVIEKESLLLQPINLSFAHPEHTLYLREAEAE